MLEFSPIRLEDGEWVRELLAKTRSMSCECCFGNLYAWQPTYSTEVSRVNDRLIVKVSSNIGECPVSFLYPVGTGDVKPAIEAILQYCKENGFCFRLYGMEAFQKEELEQAFPGKFCMEEHREHSDYVYLVEDLIALAGKKYHGKRNHLARFYENDWSFEPITDENKAECLEMNRRWCEEKLAAGMEGLSDEFTAIVRCLHNMEAVGCFGGLLRVNGEIVAFTIAERLNEDTVVVHFEKARPEIQGAYPAINREFLAQMCREYTYVNREDDLGIEGLRRAKLSYHPVALVTKYGVTPV